MSRPPSSTIKMQQEQRTTLPHTALLVIGKAGAFHQPLPRRGELVIGRDADCDLALDDTGVSRKHAKLRVGRTIQLIDLGSTNGTTVGDQKLTRDEPIELAPGALVRIGHSVLILQSTSSAPDADTDLEVRAEPDFSAIECVVPNLDRISAGTINVVILGETGVGKEVLARAIHQRSPRRSGPLVCLNCCALSETLLESELFGHERGAFTGAVQAKTGLLEAAQGGVVFLDEVGDMPLPIQAKFLRTLEQKEVLRVGSVKPRPIDVRFVSATNRDLEADVAAGRFRQDLYFRLSGVTITVPPLRERVPEIAPLARTFAAKTSLASKRPVVPAIAEDALSLLTAYPWPGNIRELRNVIERAVLLCPGDTIGLEHLPTDRMVAHLPVGNRPRSEAPLPGLRPRPTLPTLVPDLDLAPETRRLSGEEFDAIFPSKELERSRILSALRECRGNQTKAAKLLGISRRTIVSRLTEYQLPRPRGKSRAE